MIHRGAPERRGGRVGCASGTASTTHWRTVAVVCAVGSSLALGATRHAVIVGNNRGLRSEAELRFAESDAQLLAQTLTDTGSVPPRNISLLVGRPLAAVREAIRRAALQLPPEAELILYISGHADARGAHLVGEVLSWRELRGWVDTARPARTIGFIDGCFSGAVLAPKGVSFESPLKVSVTPTLTGRVLITSSGANELSYESLRVGGSPFTHALVSGLRGTADADGDGRVTVSELYASVYTRTLANSLASGAPQHPSHLSMLTGAGEWVLAEPVGARIHPGSGRRGRCYLLDDQETRVMAELSEAGPPVAAAAGRYRVKCVTETSMQSAVVAVGDAGEVNLDRLSFQPEALTAALVRGPGGPRGPSIHRLALMGGGSLEASLLGPGLSLRYAFIRGELVAEARAGVTSGNLVFGGAGLGTGLPWWPMGPTRLEIGLQLSLGRGLWNGGFSLLAGQYVQFEWRFSSLTALARFDVGSRLSLWRGPNPQSSLALSLGVSADYPFFAPGGTQSAERNDP